MAGATAYSPPLQYTPAPAPAPTAGEHSPEPRSLTPPVKRRLSRDYANAKRRRASSTAIGGPGDEGDDGADDDEDSHLGPNGGPKHWTSIEKSKLFDWILANDEK